MQDYRKLKVWEKSHQLALATYRHTGAFPKAERYGIMSQMRRASVSIPSNIAEGCGRETRTELARFLQIAMGSASELEYQVLLAKDLGLFTLEAYDEMNGQVAEVKRMLWGLLQKLRTAATQTRHQ